MGTCRVALRSTELFRAPARLRNGLVRINKLMHMKYLALELLNN